jgi:PAS domain S-box-containing protein
MKDPLDVAATDWSRTPSMAAREWNCTIDDIPAPICLIGFDGRFQQINRVWSQVLGHPPDALVGKSFAKFIHPEDARLLVRQLCDPTCEAPPESFEARFRSADGNYKWLHCQTKLIAEHQAFAIAALETSERKETEGVAKRRATVASLKAEIWSALGSPDASSDRILGIWTELVRRHLDAAEVQIWTHAASDNAPTLHFKSAASPADGSAADFKSLEMEIRQVGETDVPLLIPDVMRDPRFASRCEAFQERGVRGLILHPLRTREHVIAVLAVFFTEASGSSHAALTETIATEMGNALVRIVREEDLLEAKRDRDRLLSTPFVGFCRLDTNQNVVGWNEGAERILRWKAADVLGRRLPIATDESRAVLDACIGGALVGRSTGSLETKLRAQNGRIVDVVLSIFPLFGAAGNVSGAWLAISDLSDRKRCERLLDLQKQITEMIVKTSSAPEAKRAVLGTLCTSLGWDVGEVWEPETPGGPLRRSMSWHNSTVAAREFDLTSRKETRDEVPELAQQVRATGAVFLPRFCSKRNLARSELAGRCGLNDAIGIPVAIGESDPGCLLFFASEIDEPDNLLFGFLSAISVQFGQFLQFERAKQLLSGAREDLLQANKMDTVGRLVGGVAHDFNNLLTIILGYGEIVLEDIERNNPNRDLIAEVLGAGKRAADLTKQLLGFCRKDTAEPTSIDLNSHLTEMQKMIGRLVGEHITFTTTLAPDVGYVRADPAHIEQVVMNLVVNARDAMPGGGRLDIQTRSVGPNDRELKGFSRATPRRYVLLSVSDSGSGMDEATRTRIFEPFFTTKDSGKGTGMGLATVSEIIEQYDGQIQVESQPGEGTTFHILLPSVSRGLAPWQVDSSPIIVPRGDEIILLVEDDDRVRQLMTRGLTAQGYTVFAAADPDRALDICKGKAAEIDLVVVDVMLPVVKGPELVSQIAALNSSIRVLYVSGYGEEDVRRSELLENGAAYLQKPFSIYELGRKVHEMCGT